ncbi:asparagine synthase (glutamine-hydrolyzing) [Methylomarinum vadi]|uniref:asparagine synthase (glutamine-hydrolyzing) n=1 Tax=Methylomarinum vadi TaxID=438855 RepID=UPI0004DF0FB0|nr:asparagine synthase (glutamine-hydrolyzing) [Methylomarinum vadi]
MCGLIGAYWSKSARKESELIQAGLKTLRRRGPNDQGVESYPVDGGTVSLGHTRLSIIDLSLGGHQPMHSHDQRYSIVFNGEIYNYRELRNDLKRQGCVFHTDSDTEVLLAAWQFWGSDCLTKLVGMFAFAVFDKQKSTITCVRDPFGIKPFYYTIENGNFLFASEIAAIRALKSEKIELDWQRAYDYLVHGDYDSIEHSFLAGVKHLLPAHLIEVNIANGTISEPIQWWQPQIAENKSLSFADAAAELRERFLNNIRLHLRSDVELGAALSGGVDSSAVVCAMRHVEPDLPINTFSYIAQGSLVSEEKWVDVVNQHVGAVEYKVMVSPSELAADLDDMIIAQGEPFGSTSIYAQYRVFKLAKSHGVTVTLDGQGADELLAGYNGYPGKRIKSLLDRHQFYDAFVFLKNWSDWPGRNVTGGIKRVVGEYVEGSLYDFMRQLNGSRLSPDWIDANILREKGVALSYPKLHNPSDEAGRRVSAELAFALTQKGLPMLLRHGDRNSMRFSVESRVPFLTPDLANFLLSLPEHYLISQEGETKCVFRAAMRGIVPDEILDRRDKIGFETPEKSWLISMSNEVRGWLSVDIELPFLNQQKLIEEFNFIVTGKKSFSWQVWRWINFIRWYQLFFLK